MIHNVATNRIPPGIIIAGSRLSVLITAHGLKAETDRVPSEDLAPRRLSVILFCASHASSPPPASCSASRRDFPVEDAPVPPFSTILGNESEMQTRVVANRGYLL
jgi:hypothetical protein